ncbi:MAG: fibronectin type III domain-containing protein [Desulfuromonadaceae bacterium]
MNKKQAKFTLLLLALVLSTITLVGCGEYNQVTLPGVPATITATAGNSEATVTFTAPASNGGLAITGYTVTSTPPGGVDSNAGNTGLTHTIRSLTNGTTYTFTVHATNALGNGIESAASNAVIPAVAATVPGAPAIVTATGGIAQATVTFTAPVSDGGSTITGYTVTSMPSGGLDSNAGTTALSHTITGLTNGTSYTFTVTASNSAGTSTASAASNAVIPVAALTVPGAPTIGTATGSDAQATVTFTPPANNGGSAITGYTVTSSPGGNTISGPASPLTVTGLINRTSYTFTVTATNSVGTSGASAPSNAATPFKPVTVVQNQTASQSSYNTSSNKALPRNDDLGAYQFGSPSLTWWWGGVHLDSVDVGYGVNSTVTGASLGVFVKSAAGSSAWDINGASSVVVGLGTNAECVGVCKATLVLVSSTPACKATAKSGMTIQAQGVNTGLGINSGKVTSTTTATTYTKALTDAEWTVAGCTTNTMANFLSLPLKEVHAQMLQADMQFTTGTAPLYANGINLGGISFQ